MCAEVFLDSIVVDWMVQDRINKSTEEVEKAIAQVTEILRQLEYIWETSREI